MTLQLETIINDAWENRSNINTTSATPEVRQAVEHVVSVTRRRSAARATRETLATAGGRPINGSRRLCCCRSGSRDNVLLKSGDLVFYDKVSTKFAHTRRRSRNESQRCTRGASGHRTPARKFYCEGRYSHAVVCQCRRLRGRGHNGRHVGYCGFMRPDRQRRALVRWRRDPVAFSSRCRRTPQSSKTIASSVPVPKLLKASSWKRTP